MIGLPVLMMEPPCAPADRHLRRDGPLHFHIRSCLHHAHWTDVPL